MNHRMDFTAPAGPRLRHLVTLALTIAVMCLLGILVGCVTPQQVGEVHSDGVSVIENPDGSMDLHVAPARAKECGETGGCSLVSLVQLKELAEHAAQYGASSCERKSKGSI